jgi:transcriptional regulator with XRE-family HTH domain
MSILPSQCRAARAIIEMDRAELARRAVVPRHLVADFENGSLTPSAKDLVAIRAALEAAAVVFVDERRRLRRQAAEDARSGIAPAARSDEKSSPRVKRASLGGIFRVYPRPRREVGPSRSSQP